MPSLPRYIVALVLWISLFYNLERFAVPRSELTSISSATYVLVTVLLVAGLVLPQWRPISTLTMPAIGAISFFALKIYGGRAFWNGIDVYVTLIELTVVLVSAALAHRVGQLIADWIETVHRLFLSDLDGRVHPPDQAETIIQREMQSARRRNHPFSILLVEADAKEAKALLTATAQEIQLALAQRMGLVTLTRVMAHNLRPSDSIIEQFDRGRWLLMAAGVPRDQASAVLQRLEGQAKRLHGLKLRCGLASYPEQGLTFEDLVAAAERDLSPKSDHRSDQGALDSSASYNGEPSVKLWSELDAP